MDIWHATENIWEMEQKELLDLPSPEGKKKKQQHIFILAAVSPSCLDDIWATWNLLCIYELSLLYTSKKKKKIIVCFIHNVCFVIYIDNITQ